MFCDQCEKRNTDGAQYCRYCGSALSPLSEEKPASKADEGAAAYSEPPRQTPPPRRDRGNGGKTAIIVLLTLILLCGAVWALWYSGVIRFEKSWAAESATPVTAAPAAETAAPATKTVMSATDASTQAPETNGGDDADEEEDGTVDLPYDFGPLNDPMQNHPCKTFDTEADFLDAFACKIWLFKETHRNPKAQEINGGYVDMAANFTKGTQPSHTFYKDNSCVFMELDPETRETSGNVFTNMYQFEWLEGCTMAYIDTDLRFAYNDGTYMVMWLFYIDTDGYLVETLAINNVNDDKLICIANMNLYYEYGADNAANESTVDKTSVHVLWDDQQAFLTTLANHVWKYSYTADFPDGISRSGFGSYGDYSNAYQIWLTFTTDGEVTESYLPIDDGNSTSHTYEYASGGSTAYVFLGDNIEYNGNFYQWWVEYYINANGNLVSRFLLFNPEPREQFELDWGDIFMSINGPVQLP